MPVADTIRRKLTDGVHPARLEIVDESDKHAGHSGWRPGGETHFRVEIVAQAFDGKSRLDRQRRSTGCWRTSSKTGCTRWRSPP